MHSDSSNTTNGRILGNRIRAVTLLDEVLHLVGDGDGSLPVTGTAFNALDGQLIAFLMSLLEQDAHTLGSCCEAMTITTLYAMHR